MKLSFDECQIHAARVTKNGNSTVITGIPKEWYGKRVTVVLEERA